MSPRAPSRVHITVSSLSVVDIIARVDDPDSGLTNTNLFSPTLDLLPGTTSSSVDVIITVAPPDMPRITHINILQTSSHFSPASTVVVVNRTTSVNTPYLSSRRNLDKSTSDLSP